MVCTVTKYSKKKTSNCYQKKNGVCCGYGGTHATEHRPVEIIYTLLFCRYAKTLPQPLGRLHLTRSRTGLSSSDPSSSSTICSMDGRRVPCRRPQPPTHRRRRRRTAQGTQTTNCRRSHHAHQHHPAKRQAAMLVSKIARSFPQHTSFFFLAIPCFVVVFHTPSFNPCRISCYFFLENLKLHISREQIKKGPYLHFWAPPVQWWGQSRKLDNFLTT